MKDITRIPIRLDKLFLLKKTWLVSALYSFAFTVFFFTSLYPWFLWHIEQHLSLLSLICVAGAWILSKTCPKPFTMHRWVWIPTLFYAILRVLVIANKGDNPFSLAVFVNIALTLSLLMADGCLMRRALITTSKVLAVVVIISLSAFLLNFTIHPLPSSTIVYGDMYTFYNFRFFLISEGDIWSSVIRFQSVFIEPAYLAVASVFLLMVQIGEWKRWYNIVLMVAIIVSFSLEGYVLLFMLFFFSKWIQRKNFIRNFLILSGFFSSIIVASFFYNDGDNLFNMLIMQRLEVDDGELSGNNRTTDTFDAEFDSFLHSGDILFGRQMYERFGNSGYKEFIYTKGVVGLFLVIVFYSLILYNPRNKRPALTATAITFIEFMVRAFMLLSSCYLTMFYMAQHYEVPKTLSDDREE